MELVRYIVRMEKIDDIFDCIPMGDLHLGNEACDEQSIIKHINEIVECPTKFTINIGDNFENNSVISRNAPNKHFRVESVMRSKYPTLEQQLDRFLELWEPLVKPTTIFPMSKTIGIHPGNHEDRTLEGEQFIQRVCKPLEEKFQLGRSLYLGNFAFTQVDFRFKERTINKYIIVSAHGTNFGGQKLGSVLNAAHQKFTQYNFDVALFGHTHFAGIEKFNVGSIVDMGEGLAYVEKKHLIANTGAFVRSHMEGVDLYTDKSFGSLRNKGTVTITFNPYENKIFGHV